MDPESETSGYARALLSRKLEAGAGHAGGRWSCGDLWAEENVVSEVVEGTPRSWGSGSPGQVGDGIDFGIEQRFEAGSELAVEDSAADLEQEILTGGFRHPSLFSLRRLTSPSVEATRLIAPLRPAGSLRPFGLGIPARAALSAPLQDGLRFLRHPLPPPPSPFLAVGIPSPRSDGASGAYPVVHCGEADG